MKITNKILFLIGNIFCSFTVMAMEKKYTLAERLPLSVLPQSTSDEDKAIVKVLNNLPIVTKKDKNYVDTSPIKSELKKIERRIKDLHETEILRQKAQYLEEKLCLNNKIIDLSKVSLAYQDKIRKETFFHRYPTITWGLGFSFGLAIGFGLFKLCGWFQ